MGIQLPDHYPSLAKKCGAKSWVSKLQDLGIWFHFIDHIAEGLQLIPDNEPPDKAIVAVIGAKVHAMKQFVPWAVDRGAVFDTREEAQDACVAVGWCILQMYYKTVDKKKWVKRW